MHALCVREYAVYVCDFCVYTLFTYQVHKYVV